MSTPCRQHLDQIPKALLGDLNAAARQALDSHLSECAACRREWDLHSATLQELHSLEDVAAPRHFFVHPEAAAPGPWHLFRRLAWGWQTAAVASLLILGVGIASTASQLQMRSQDGTFMVRFGPGSFPDLAPRPPLDIEALQERILTRAIENSRAENLEWVRALRTEITQSNLALSERQNIMLASALTDLESRLAGRIASAATKVQDQTEKSLNSLYRTISLERQEVFTALSQRLTRLAISGELKSNQTDAILETLLQVAELRLTDTPGGQK
jgi:hypothetical protein